VYSSPCWQPQPITEYEHWLHVELVTSTQWMAYLSGCSYAVILCGRHIDELHTFSVPGNQLRRLDILTLRVTQLGRIEEPQVSSSTCHKQKLPLART